MEGANRFAARRSFEVLKDEFHREASEGGDYFGLNDLNLADQERSVEQDLRLGGGAITWRTVFDDIGNEHISALKSIWIKKRVKVFAGPADKRPSWLRLGFTGRLTDKEKRSVRISFTRNREKTVFNSVGI